MNSAALLKSVRAPGKLILCGEHLVVHGGLALVQTIPLYTSVQIRRREKGAIHLDGYTDNYREGQVCTLHSPLGQLIWSLGLPFPSTASAFEWLEKLLKLLSIPDCLRDEGASNGAPDLLKGWDMVIESEIPSGSGLGSSAAVIVASLLALIEYYGLSIDRLKVWEIAKEAEAACHGRSSGLDLAASLWGGRLRFSQGQVDRVEAAPLEHVYRYYTGKPIEATWECVERSTALLSRHSMWLERMKEELEELLEAIQGGGWDRQKEGVQRVHRSLIQLQVVPQAVQEKIAIVERLGGCAKISGAGSLTGSGSGWILIWAREPALAELKRLNWDLQPLAAPVKGAYGDL